MPAWISRCCPNTGGAAWGGHCTRTGWRRPAPPDGPGYDVVFADPPYAVTDTELQTVLTRLVAGGWLAPQAVVVVERSTRGPALSWVEGITAERGRRYGETMLWYGRRS